MDVRVGSFVWDVAKDLINIYKHGIGFSKAIAVFHDPKRIVIFDSRHSVYEERYFCVGNVDDRILTVRFLYHGHTIRIIGAACWRKWRRYYEKENS